MKKIVLLSLFALCLPLAVMAQSNNDDLYFVPSKEKKQEAEKIPVKKVPEKRTVTTNIYTAPGTTVVVQDRKGNKRDMRDVDEYNRRYDAKDNEFAMEDDTLYVKEKAVSDPDGEWVNGFNGSQDDYEYAERIIRFRNPRFAVSISSPLYWDIVYGANSWDWNVYTDGFYAYAFPTFTNRLWWDWRYNSYGPGWGWGWGWSSPYYAWGGYYPGYWGGYWGGWYGGYWGHHHHYHPGWGGGGSWAGRYDTYTRRGSSAVRSSYGNSSTVRRYGSGAVRSNSGSSVRSSGTSSYNRGESSARRVIGTRVVGERPGSTTRTDASSSRRSTYTRPSSTRSSSSYEGTRGGSTTTGSPSYSEGGRRASTRSSSTYTRGSSTAPSRSYNESTTRRSYNSTPSRSSSSSTRSYSSPSGSSSRSYSTGGGGGSSRSSGGGGGSSRGRR
ncbi:hypothetical protein [Bacteroides fragilis]|uniref:hypothetical protein n=1 Tax=Bacteroides TaxID=816 RepID=UPI001C6FEFE5|nr:hypothetical protein [Bacteroides fragilis]MBW9279622.1 hypothetical protein [Bacteroides fragilis]